MVYETKAILSLLARHIGNSKTVEEAYEAVVEAANVEGLEIPSYKEFIKRKNDREAEEQ